MVSTPQLKLEELFRKLCKDMLLFSEDKIFSRRELSKFKKFLRCTQISK